MSLTENVKSDR